MRVAVIGAGVSGLAAAVALAQDGANVVLLERRPFVGGRAYSYPHPALGETIDSQHVILGCCTNFLDLIQQTATTQPAAPPIRWYDTLTFLEPARTQNRVPQVRQASPSDVRMNGIQTSTIYPSPLPAPFHNSLSFLRAPMLTLRDKLGIATGLTHFLSGYPASDVESFATWLKRTHQTDRAIRHFWEPIVVGALNDSFANCSTRYAGKVFHESFLRSPEAGRLGIPAAPLSDFFAPVAAHARALGVDLRLNTTVNALTQIAGNRWLISTSTGDIDAGAVILATDLAQTQAILATLSGKATASEIDRDRSPNSSDTASTEGNAPEIGRDFSPGTLDSTSRGALAPGTRRSAQPQSSPIAFAQFTKAPITTIHLWYDREITTLDHAVLLDTRIQWVFNKSRIRQSPGPGTYLELVISASFAEISRTREQILAEALAELELFFPQVRDATLLKSAVLKEARATFSVTPGLDAHRPPQTTPYPNLYVAADWTATGWPSTMEGAIRGGRLAAGTLTSTPNRFLAPELPATGLMRLLTRKP